MNPVEGTEWWKAVVQNVNINGVPVEYILDKDTLKVPLSKQMVPNENITVLVGEDVMESESDELEDRQFYGYGRPRRRRFRRFRRQLVPLAFLTALSLLPYSYPYYHHTTHTIKVRV